MPHESEPSFLKRIITKITNKKEERIQSPEEKKFQQIYEENLRNGLIFKAEEVFRQAKEKNIELKEISKEFLQESCIERLKENFGNLDSLREILGFAKNKGMEIVFSGQDLEDAFNFNLKTAPVTDANIEGAKAIIVFAKEQGKDIKVSPKALQESFDFILGSGRFGVCQMIIEYAKSFNYDIKASSKVFENCFYGNFNSVAGFVFRELEGLVKFAKEKGVKMDIPKKFLLKQYKKEHVLNKDQIIFLAKELNIELSDAELNNQ